MLHVENIYFKYQDKFVLQDVSFQLNQGKTLAIIGESGCGKSTLLKLLYGLKDADQGSIFWNEKQVQGPKFHLVPGMDFMKYLAQDFDLMPFISVAENVGKFLSNFYPDVKKERIDELLEVVEMSEFAHVKAQFLSGGQMQRVALARVLAREPEVMLLDEPFSHIDNFRKNSLRRKLFAYLKQKNITCVMATHDSSEILSFADEMLVMKNGSIIESGIPSFIYQNPKHFYTASLFGDCSEIPSSIFKSENELWMFPHQLKFSESSGFPAKVLQCFFRGSHYLIEARADFGTIFFESNENIPKNQQVLVDRKK
jgi:ABC-type sulfate/molybdate transport systems ATPase subunit